MIEFKSVKYHLGNKQFEYDFSVSSSITGIYGHSGAGKTTLFNLLSGLAAPDRGQIILNHTQLFNNKEKISIPPKNRNIGYVFQENLLFPHLSVNKNLLYSKPYKRNKIQNIEFNDVVELLDLGPLLNLMPRQLSGGERQRVAIGRALLSQPGLLLLDEPFSNVDCSKRKQIISYLIRVNNHFHVPMLIISHYLEDILKLTQNILLVENGKVTTQDHVFNIIKNGEKTDLIRPEKYQNPIYAYFANFDKNGNIFNLLTQNKTEIKISTNSKLISPDIIPGTKIHLSIKPDDISLSTEYIEETSLQNQIKGKVNQIIESKNNIFCVIDCGFELLVELSQTSREKLLLHTGQDVYCQVKAKSFDVVHISNEVIQISPVGENSKYIELTRTI